MYFSQLKAWATGSQQQFDRSTAKKFKIGRTKWICFVRVEWKVNWANQNTQISKNKHTIITPTTFSIQYFVYENEKKNKYIMTQIRKTVYVQIERYLVASFRVYIVEPNWAFEWHCTNFHKCSRSILKLKVFFFDCKRQRSCF